jgi:hypothetical protein
VPVNGFKIPNAYMIKCLPKQNFSFNRIWYCPYPRYLVGKNVGPTGTWRPEAPFPQVRWGFDGGIAAPMLAGLTPGADQKSESAHGVRTRKYQKLFLIKIIRQLFLKIPQPHLLPGRRKRNLPGAIAFFPAQPRCHKKAPGKVSPLLI